MILFMIMEHIKIKIAMFKDATLKLNVNIKDCLIIEDSKVV